MKSYEYVDHNIQVVCGLIFLLMEYLFPIFGIIFIF